MFDGHDTAERMLVARLNGGPFESLCCPATCHIDRHFSGKPTQSLSVKNNRGQLPTDKLPVADDVAADVFGCEITSVGIELENVRPVPVKNPSGSFDIAAWQSSCLVALPPHSSPETEAVRG